MLDNQEIKRLLSRATAHDEGSAEAFERLYKLCAPLLLGVALRVLGRREVAEEVLHDAFTGIWHKAIAFDPLATQPVARMVAIVRNRAIDVRASHDVSRVDSYHDSVDNFPRARWIACSSGVKRLMTPRTAAERPVGCASACRICRRSSGRRWSLPISMG